jgi:TolB-like protein
MPDVYISHDSSDREHAKVLVKALRQRGWSVWDRSGLPGSNLRAMADTALRAARCVVVVWSRRSVASDEVMGEADDAMRRGILVPVLVDDATVPFEFSGIHTPRLAVPDSVDELQEIADAVQKLASYDIFVSYDSIDRDRVRPLMETLDKCGWSVWWDRKIRPGERYRRIIKKALDTAKAVLVVWSKESVRSNWVLAEAGEGKQRNILVPVAIDDIELPFQFRAIQTADLAGWPKSRGKRERDLYNLKRALLDLVGRGEIGPEPPEPRPWRLAALLGATWNHVRDRPVATAGLVLAACGVVVSLVAYAPKLGAGRGTDVSAAKPIRRPVVYFKPIVAGSPAEEEAAASTNNAFRVWLSKVKRLRFISDLIVDAWAQTQNVSWYDATRHFGVQQAVSGDLSKDQGRLTLLIRLSDVATGDDLGSDRFPEGEAGLPRLQQRAWEFLLAQLDINLSEQKRKKIAGATAARTRGQPYESSFFDQTYDDAEAPPPTSIPRPSHGASLVPWPPVADAADVPTDSAVRQVLDRYQQALANKNVDELAALYVAMTDGQRAALTGYFQRVKDLRVRFSDFTVIVEGEEAVATFTREDRFKEVNSGEDVEVAVRVSTALSRIDGNWKIRALRKPS